MEREVLTVFRSRLAEGASERYEPLAAAMWERASRAPGFLAARSYRAEDGERVTIVRFADASSQAAWRDDEEHRAAQVAGREGLYAWFDITVAEVVRHAEWP